MLLPAAVTDQKAHVLLAQIRHTFPQLLLHSPHLLSLGALAFQYLFGLQDRFQHLRPGKRLDDQVERPQLHRLLGVREVGVAGQKNQFGLRLLGQNRPHHRQPVSEGHADVGQYNIRPVLADLYQPFLSVGRRCGHRNTMLLPGNPL
ncbi:hypothetical protein D3C76_1337660 [compost metagenome]